MFDEFGPEKMIEVYNSRTGMHGFTVIDNTALGPAKGGIRMTPFVSINEVFRLARAMTWKNSLAELPFGGGKSGIVFDPHKHPKEKKREMVQSFSRAIRPVCPDHYIAGPDINTTEEEMRWFAEANGSLKACTGKPANLGGIPHELGSTGYGVYHSTLVACEHLGIVIKGSTVAIEGFGNVGWFAAKFLSEEGAKLVAVSDSKGTAYLKDGMDFRKLADTKKSKGTVTAYEGAKKLGTRQILSAKTDILITAAIPDLFSKKDVPKMRFRVIVEGSNIPTSEDAEKALHRKKVLVIPDFVANAGGVISSYVEHMGGHPKDMFKLVEQKIRKNTQAVLELTSPKRFPRDAALRLARQRVKEKMDKRV